MGSIGNSSTSTVEEKFTYQRSSDIKEWTEAEEKCRNVPLCKR